MADTFDWRSFSDEAVEAVRSHQHPSTRQSSDCAECSDLLRRYEEARD